MIVINDKVEFKKLIAEVFREELEGIHFASNKETLPISEELINIKQLQILLKLSKPSIYKLMRAQKLPFRRAGRRLLFPKAEVLEALNKSSKI